MRLLLQPTGSAPAAEVDVPPGTRAQDVRTALSRLTGDPRWSTPGARLAAGAVAVDDEHPCGRYPLLAGAELRLRRGPTPPDEAALHARFHVAVVAGPDCGALAAVAPGLVVGRGAATVGGTHLRVEDPELSREHLGLTARRRHVLVRDLRTSNGTLVARADRRGTPREPLTGGEHPRPRRTQARRLRGRAVRLRTGDRLHVGSTVLELRGPRRRRDRAAAPADGPGTGPGAWLWLGPAVGSAALAVSTGNPVLLVGALLGPVLMLAHAGRARAHRRRAPQAGAVPGLSGRGTTPGRPTGTGGAPPGDADEAPLAPADLAAATVLATVPGVPPTTTPAADGTLRRLGHAAVGARGLTLAVTGRRHLALGAARALALGLVGPDGRGALLVRCDADRRAEWRWARWLAEAPTPTYGHGPVVRRLAAGAPGAARVVVVDGPAVLARTRADHGGPGTALVLVVDGPGSVPAWCTSVLAVGPDGSTARVGGTRRPLPLHAVTAAWAETHARRVAGARAGGSLEGVPLAGRPASDGSVPVAPYGTAPDAGARSLGGEDPLPGTVALGELDGVPPPDASAVAARWAEPAAPGLRAALGVDRAGAVHVDLVADGPHALVAGTTGAGKSGLLQTLVLTLALTHPPERLAVALVDYKGGASFGPVARLPHVVGQVTDLDGALAERALAGLRAELHRRERLLAEAGAPDVDALAAEHRAGRTSVLPPPRLLVVVDEFRALADEVPTFVPGLLRVAAQGRALGMHLVLATQRPAGAVGPDLRANITLRVALRVADGAESTDVLGVPDAAALPVDRPGRAVLRRGNRAPEQLQVALPHGRRRQDGVRLAAPWLTASSAWVPTGPDVAHEDDGLSRYVEAVRTAARGLPCPVSPWLPALPERVTRGEVRDDAADAGTLPTSGDVLLGLGDVPAEQRRSLVAWRPADGHLLVRGGPGSGRTTALRTAVHGALELGWDVHAVGFPPDALPAPAELLGTVVGPDDPRRLARLVRLLAGCRAAPRATGDGAGPPDRPQLLVVDGLEPAVAALDGVARGAAGELFVDLLRDGRARRVAVAAGCGSGSGLASLVGHFGNRLVLGPADPVTDVLAGVPTELARGRRPPGRAVHVGDGGAVLCQVAVAEGPPSASVDATPRHVLRLVPVPTHVTLPSATDTAPGPAGAAPRDRRAPLDPRAPGDLPATVDPWPLERPAIPDTPAAVTRPATHAVPVGRGGDSAEVLTLDVQRGALVVGPPGSGRTTALAAVASALVRAGRDVAVLADDAPLADMPGARWSVGSRELGDLLGHLENATGPVDVVVDDLDALEVSAPHLVERLVAWLERGGDARRGPGAVASRTGTPGAGTPGADTSRAGPPGTDLPVGGERPTGAPVPRDAVAPGSRLVASSSTARAATAYRPPLAALRHSRRGIVLHPHEPGSAEVFGTAVEWALDPAHPHLLGRGVLVTGRDVVPLQVALPPWGGRG
ncbi:FtsK/SpoIIIE domain-containing protein [Cellulomonas sp. NS3]|uniref:FtsK/SpoIIIE domain-containing protein n=1 Tax=Cellulomonas sp. NS3 TaxID=2973977 RepID=UPI002162BF17|nr:FtsK/SpoIIIE domain-containing protein [Cellulomonas sp. NS3]